MDTLLPLFSFPLCLVFTPLVRRLATKKGWIAHPSAERWHRKPTALMGGVAIYLAVSLPLFFIADFTSLFSFLTDAPEAKGSQSIAGTLWLGMSLLFLLGLLDDFISIKPHTKLVGQILVASLTIFLGFRLHWFTSMTLDTTLSIVWIVGITNAFNLIDNMDGLCAGIGCIAAGYMALLFCGATSLGACWAAIALFGALFGFLFYNFFPATIFMGDSGSLAIGYSLSLLSLYYAQSPAVTPHGGIRGSGSGPHGSHIGYYPGNHYPDLERPKSVHGRERPHLPSSGAHGLHGAWRRDVPVSHRRRCRLCRPVCK